MAGGGWGDKDKGATGRKASRGRGASGFESGGRSRLSKSDSQKWRLYIILIIIRLTERLSFGRVFSRLRSEKENYGNVLSEIL
jgi:hypothetical protein